MEPSSTRRTEYQARLTPNAVMRRGQLAGQADDADRVGERDTMDQLAGRIRNLDILIEVDLAHLAVGGHDRARFRQRRRGDAARLEPAAFRVEQDVLAVSQMEEI